MAIKRHYPIGAEIFPEGVHFRVWAPDHNSVDLVLENTPSPISLPMKKERNGYFSLLVKEAAEGSLYRFSLSNALYYDPASRYQPHGPQGPSCVIDPSYPWRDRKWRGVKPHNIIAYELHVGTFTEKGTFESAKNELQYLADLGINLIEMMPIADFPGHFGWGYDGVNLFAPSHLYGTPQDLKAFIDEAHRLGIGLILDVVYNHLGAEENQIIHFAKEYLSSEFNTDWGTAINFDSPQSRAYFLTNAAYWIEEFHFDGLRLDATPWFFSSTKTHILKELSQVVKRAGGSRNTLVVGENEQQNTQLLRPYEKDGYGFDILWNDDFHHSAHVRLTGKREAYFTDYLGSPQEFISSVKYGYLYQGQYYDWQKQPRGKSFSGLSSENLMVYLENHDQLANSGSGIRLQQRSDPGSYKVLTALFILGPNIPLIFQGQEFNSSKPFCYFADHSSYFSPLVNAGRKKELSQFPRLRTEEVRKTLPDPANPATFTQCKLDHNERVKNQKTLLLYKDLIHLKKSDPVFSKSYALRIDGAVLSPDAFLLRFFSDKAGDRLVILNFGADLHLNPAPEPLLAAGDGLDFELIWSSESLCYGGEGNPPINIPYWKILGHSVIVLKTVRCE